MTESSELQESCAFKIQGRSKNWSGPDPTDPTGSAGPGLVLLRCVPDCTVCAGLHYDYTQIWVYVFAQTYRQPTENNNYNKSFVLCSVENLKNVHSGNMTQSPLLLVCVCVCVCVSVRTCVNACVFMSAGGL